MALLAARQTLPINLYPCGQANGRHQPLAGVLTLGLTGPCRSRSFSAERWHQ